MQSTIEYASSRMPHVSLHLHRFNKSHGACTVAAAPKPPEGKLKTFFVRECNECPIRHMLVYSEFDFELGCPQRHYLLSFGPSSIVSRCVMPDSPMNASSSPENGELTLREQRDGNESHYNDDNDDATSCNSSLPDDPLKGRSIRIRRHEDR